MSADTSFRQPTSRNALAVVAVLVALSAGAAFALQTYFAYGFARHVWGLPREFAPCVPIGLDLFVATLMAATYILRNAPRNDRRTLWALTVVGILLQVAAAESFAQWKHAPVAGSVAALAPALMLAATLHTLIKVRRESVVGAAPGRMLAAPHWAPMTEKKARALADARGAAMRGPVPDEPKKPRVSRRRQRQAGQTSPHTTWDDIERVMAERRVGRRRAQQIVKAARASQPVSPAPAGGRPAIAAGAIGSSDAPAA